MVFFVMIITISSGKGGVGKTTVAVNLVTALRLFGKDVILVDTNITTPNVGLHLGFPLVNTTLNDVLRGDRHISEAIYLHPIGLRVVPSSLSLHDLQEVDIDKLPEVVEELKNYGEIIVMDSAAGLGKEAISALITGKEILVVVNPEIPSLADALKVVRLAEELGNKKVKVVVNKYSNKKNISLEQIESLLEKPIIGVIPEHPKFHETLEKKEPFVYRYPKLKPSIEYKKIAANLIGEEYHEKPNENIIKRLLNKILYKD